MYIKRVSVQYVALYSAVIFKQLQTPSNCLNGASWIEFIGFFFFFAAVLLLAIRAQQHLLID